MTYRNCYQISPQANLCALDKCIEFATTLPQDTRDKLASQELGRLDMSSPVQSNKASSRRASIDKLSDFYLSAALGLEVIKGTKPASKSGTQDLSANGVPALSGAAVEANVETNATSTEAAFEPIQELNDSVSSQRVSPSGTFEWERILSTTPTSTSLCSSTCKTIMS